MIRRAEERDVGRLAEILVFAKRTAYRPVFQDDRFSFGELQVLPTAAAITDAFLKETLVWEEDGVLKGMLRGGPIGADCWEVHQLYIDPFFQREGIGSRLMMAFLEQARESGASSVILWVLEENLSARSFYERVGFSFGGEIQKVGKTDKRQLLYRLSLEGEESQWIHLI